MGLQRGDKNPMYFTFLDLSGKGYNFIAPCDSTHFGGNTAMKTQVFFSGALSGIAEG